ncbi:MAG: 6-bladed beta-propeller [Candidatus Marinimicrobia bacterium]|nr:6-bladed beta-propeller [Candidatus Neomarinimicrobiota bacterium]MCF7922442.1 6-bladed beta-propeller [Candidatus Neomarinimicrobiota bacterium]
MPKGLLGRILGVIVGPERQFSLNQPTDMVVDQLGRLLIVESEAGYISIYSKIEGVWINSARVHLPEILHPNSIASSPDKIYISDLMGGTVHILDYEFNPVGAISYSDMVRPGSLFYDGYSKRLYVADPPAHRVFVFTIGGEFVANIGSNGSSQARLQSPVAVTVDQANGQIYVLDGMARKVKQYDAEFKFIRSFGEYDQVPGSFAFPKGIALASDGTLFVGDAAFGNIQLFDPSGALLFYFGETGTGQGQFLLPRNLYIDQEQHLFVADPYNNRVQIFRYFPQ